MNFPDYPCPVELKKRSSGFGYQIRSYPRLPRVVVLCLDHDSVHTHEHVDVIEVRHLARYFSS